MDRLTTTIVAPDGPLNAKVCFIGQAPGAEEDATGRPFVGEAGKLWTRCLKGVGRRRSEILVTNVFMQRPPNNDVNYYFQDKSNTKPTWEGQEHIDKLQEWLQNLLMVRETSGVGPNVLVAMGREAMMVLTGRKRIMKWRGSILPCTLVPGFKVYPTLHPSFVMRLMNEPEERLSGLKKQMQMNALPLFLKDLQRAFEQSEFPEIRRPEREFRIGTSVDEVQDFLRNIIKSERRTSVDIETLDSPEGRLVWCIGFGPRPDLAMCIPIIRNRRLVWTTKEEAAIWRTISEVFLHEGILKIFQGGFYDLSILGRYYGLRLKSGTYGDTMWLHHASYPYIRKALEVLCSIYTWEPYYKDDGKVWDGRRISDYAEFQYNARDCCVQREIYPVVKRDAQELGTFPAYVKQMRRSGSLLHMQIRGVKIDVEKKERLEREFSEKAREHQEEFWSIAGKEYNLDSHAQIKKLFYGYYDFPIQYNHKTGKATVDKDARNRLLRKVSKDSDEWKLIHSLSEYKKLNKLVTTYATMEVDPDGRIHTNYGWINTWRLFSSGSHFGGGGNLQNIPTRTDEGRAIRELFIPDPGMILLGTDSSQAEAREVAWLAGDEALIELYLQDYDVHWHRARDIFQIPDEMDEAYYKTHKEEEFQCPFLDEPHPLKWFRNIGKTIVYAGYYKMGPRMLQTILIREEAYLPESTCKQLLMRFKARNPFITMWQNKTIEEIRATRMLETCSPFNRRREFRGRLNDSLYRSAIAFRPQSTVGELIQEAIQNTWEETDLFEPLLNVHDEMIGQCREEDVRKVAPIMKRHMEMPHYPGGRELIIPCDFKIGPSWGELKEVSYETLTAN